MHFHKPLSRRFFLRGSAGAVVGLPFLNAMLPSTATAQTGNPRRFIMAHAYGPTPSTYVNLGGGALPSDLGPNFRALEPVRDLVTIVTDLEIPR
ncbi:MAG: twin-arginine translocation signal domain-containing protein, partial [Myxococcota bacterium]